MKCPVCPEQTLETLSGPEGSFERCPNCLGLFIHQDLIVAASKDKDNCRALLAETAALLLPTDKWCPKCLQKLFDGRIQSRGIICTLCPVCTSHWTNLPTLGLIEEAIETSFQHQMNAAANTSADIKSSLVSSASHSSTESHPPINDAGLGHMFRSVARLFDGMADRFGRKSPKPAIAKPIKSPEKVIKPAKKPLFVEVRPAAPEPQKKTEPLVEAPSIEIPEFVFPKDTEIKPEPEPQPEPVAPAPEPEPVISKPPVFKPVEAIPLPQPSNKRPGFMSTLKAAWSSPPKKAAKLSTPVKPMVTPPKTVPPPKQVKPPKPAGP